MKYGRIEGREGVLGNWREMLIWKQTLCYFMTIVTTCIDQPVRFTVIDV